MDPLEKKLFKELELMQNKTGRMLRSMAVSRMMPMDSGGWQPPVDIYEAASELYVCVDLAGVEPRALEVTVDQKQLVISGKRQLPIAQTVVCVHQLEIELGSFSRTIALPAGIDIDSVRSTYSQGILVVTLPMQGEQGKVNIVIESGE